MSKKQWDVLCVPAFLRFSSVQELIQSARIWGCPRAGPPSQPSEWMRLLSHPRVLDKVPIVAQIVQALPFLISLTCKLKCTNETLRDIPCFTDFLFILKARMCSAFLIIYPSFFKLRIMVLMVLPIWLELVWLMYFVNGQSFHIGCYAYKQSPLI